MINFFNKLKEFKIYSKLKMEKLLTKFIIFIFFNLFSSNRIFMRRKQQTYSDINYLKK